MTNQGNASRNDLVNRIIRAVVLIVVALILAVVSVSFAVHHMRLKFEDEYRGITQDKMSQVSSIIQLSVNGDEIVQDPQAAANKYSAIFNLILADTSESSFSSEEYGLFLYSNGELTGLTCSDVNNTDEYLVLNKDISEWLTSDNDLYIYTSDEFDSVLVPIADSTGKCVAVFEYKTTYDDLDKLGNVVENRILKAVMISVFVGIVIFLVQLLIPKIIKRYSSTKGGVKY